jgi:uncharacterized protein
MLGDGPLPEADLVGRLSGQFASSELGETIAELRRVRAIGENGVAVKAVAKQMPPADFPLTTMVLNVTNQCNLSCTYCYEYGEDKIVDTENGRKPKFMTEDTARESVDFMFRQAGANRYVHLTFFGGETLLNFPVLKSTLAYAVRRAEELGKQVDFSLTTNASCCGPRLSNGWSRTRLVSPFRSTAPKRCRTSSASSRAAWAVTTSSPQRSASCCGSIPAGPSVRGSR